MVRVYLTECIQCKKFFETNKLLDPFCSLACLDSYFDVRKNLDVKKVKVNRKCLYCGLVKIMNSGYCCRNCKSKDYFRKNRKKWNKYQRDLREKRKSKLSKFTTK
jgi:hypothetical protein